MNNNVNQDNESPSRVFETDCYGLDATVATVHVFADDGNSYQLPYSQFLYSAMAIAAGLKANDTLVREELRLHFSMAEVTVRGRGLKAIEKAIQKYELKHLRALDQRFAAALKTHVAAVTVKFTKEAA